MKSKLPLMYLNTIMDHQICAVFAHCNETQYSRVTVCRTLCIYVPIPTKIAQLMVATKHKQYPLSVDIKVKSKYITFINKHMYLCITGKTS